MVNCGASLSENNTYFESDGDEKSHCSIQVCKASEKIVQVIDYLMIHLPKPIRDTVQYDKTTCGILKWRTQNCIDFWM